MTSTARPEPPRPTIRRAVIRKGALVATAGAAAGLLAYHLLAGLRAAVFAALRELVPLHDFLLRKPPAYARTFGEIVNDSLAFAFLGMCLLPALVWAAGFERGRWLKSPARLTAVAALGGLCGGVSIFCIQKFLVNPPGVALPPMGRGLAIMLTWLCVGPCFGVVISFGLKRVSALEGLAAGATGGLLTGVCWTVCYLCHVDPDGFLQFPVAGAVFGVCLVLIRLLFTAYGLDSRPAKH